MNAKRVYAFEGDKSAYKQLANNLRYLPEKYKTKVKAINHMITENSD